MRMCDRMAGLCLGSGNAPPRPLLSIHFSDSGPQQAVSRPGASEEVGSFLQGPALHRHSAEQGCKEQLGRGKRSWGHRPSQNGFPDSNQEGAGINNGKNSSQTSCFEAVSKLPPRDGKEPHVKAWVLLGAQPGLWPPQGLALLLAPPAPGFHPRSPGRP